MPPRIARLAGIGAFAAIPFFVAIFALVAYAAIPRRTGGIDDIEAAVTWISVGLSVLSLVGLHVVVGRGLLDLSRGRRRGI